MADNPTSLDKLHDIVMPEPISWWPLAPGWYVIALALIIICAWTCIWFISHWQKNSFRREALKELENIRPSELPELIKRIALSLAPRHQVAALSGDDWLRFLDQTGNTTAFTKTVGQQLLDLSYAPTRSVDLEFTELKSTIRNWILTSTLLTPNT